MRKLLLLAAVLALTGGCAVLEWKPNGPQTPADAQKAGAAATVLVCPTAL